MGSGTSMCYKLPQPHADVPYFVIMFQMPCAIRIGLADAQTIEAIRRACFSVVPREEIEFDGRLSDDSYKIRLSGTPFAPASDHKDALASRKVAARILMELYVMGWRLIASSDLSRSDDLSTWFFKREEKKDPVRIVCVGLSSSDILQMVGDFDESLKIALKMAIETGYGPGLQTERQPSSDYYEVKLRGYPWAGNSSREDAVWSRRALLQIIRLFHDHNFKFYGTVNLKGTADALFFIEEDANEESEREAVKIAKLKKSDDEHLKLGVHFCAISLDRKDRLTMIDCPSHILESAREAILNHWKGGLQEEYNAKRHSSTGKVSGRHKSAAASLKVRGAREFKMKGYPWWGDGADTVTTRVFLSKLFQTMLAHGYAVIGALDLSRHFNDKAVFILRSHAPIDLPHICLSMHDVDKIRLVNNTDETTKDNVDSSLHAMWPYGLSEQNSDYYGSYEWTLRNQPWSSFGRSNKTLIARVMMCYVLRAFLDRGWTLLAAADVSARYLPSNSGPDFSCDVDSWFFADTRRLGGNLTGFKL